MKYILYDYYRSSASFRVRIALNLKKIPYEKIAVDLVKDGGEQLKPEYKQLNPQSLVPTLVIKEQNIVISQSMAILEFLEDLHPEPELKPKDSLLKARANQIANIVACDIHPLNNLRVLKYITGKLKHSEDDKLIWYKHWIELGFKAIEQLLQPHQTDEYCIGNSVTLADICLIPQVYNANRFNISLEPYPIINKVNNNCLKLAAFTEAKP